jgi:hypothetical protein
VIKTQVEIMRALDEGKGNWPEGDLYSPNPEPPHFKSRKAYRNNEPEIEDEISDSDSCPVGMPN